MTPKNFQNLINSEKSSLDVQRHKGVSQAELEARLKALEVATERRLEAGLYVTDETVTTVVYAWTEFESPYMTGQLWKRDAQGRRFPETRRCIERLLPMIQDRPLLEAALHQRKGYVLQTDGDAKGAVSEYTSASQILTSLQDIIAERRIESIVDTADLLSAKGDQENAEKFYLLALSYDWTGTQDAEAYQRGKDLYLRAGRGLIDVRRNRLSALKDTYFISTALKELGPDLQKAIKLAGGSDEDVKNVMAGYK